MTVTWVSGEILIMRVPAGVTTGVTSGLLNQASSNDDDNGGAISSCDT